MTDVSTAYAVVIFRVKVSCITSVDDIEFWLLTWLVNKSSRCWVIIVDVIDIIKLLDELLEG